MQTKIKQKIKELGNVFDFELIDSTFELYIPLLNEADLGGVNVSRNMSYGTHERQKLDIYKPDKDPDKDLPVLIFIHGGGFITGSKDEYRNIGYYFARQGVLTVIPSYRLAPGSRWPSGARDVAGVVKLIKEEAGLHGGNPDHIILMGHSAGAAHVATFMYDRQFRAESQKDVTGGILISCPVLDLENVNEFDQAYYGEDASQYSRMAVLDQIKADKRNVFVLFAEYDDMMFETAAMKLINAFWQADNRMPFIKRCIHHNHVSEIMQFNTGDTSIGPDLLEFIEKCKP